MESLKRFEDSLDAALYLLSLGVYAQEIKDKMMKREIHQTSAVIIPEPETEDYSWEFLISPRSKIQKNIESVASGGFNFHSLQFQTGFLAETDHKWGFSIYANQINTFMSLPKRDRDHRYMVHDAKLRFLSHGELKSTRKLTLQCDEATMAPRVLWTGYWVNSDQSWDDTIDSVRVTFKVGRESCRCLHSPATQQIVLKNQAVLQTVKHINCEEFLQSDYLSDIILECKAVEFPAHRFILSCRSPVFNRMFRAGMSEDKEGRVKIEDMEPEVLQELLRFIYCSQVSPRMGEICIELLEAADRYDIEPLKILCETEMIEKVSTDNALELYMTAELHNARVLKEKAFDIIAMNRREVFSDRETFKAFIGKCPDIAYDLLFSPHHVDIAHTAVVPIKPFTQTEPLSPRP